MAALFTTLAVAPALADPVDVDIVSADGLPLKGTYYAAVAAGPGVLLLHQCNRDRTGWDDLARGLSDAGLHVLTLDFRGFGESVDKSNRSFEAQGSDLWPLFDDDVERTYEFLASMPGVDPERIGVLGASCGGSQALLLAGRHDGVKAVGFLSSDAPWIPETDIEAFESNRTDVAFLGIAAEGDEAAAAMEQRLFGKSPHPASKLILYKGARHGIPLFEQDPHLTDVIVSWFVAAL
jgi:dienelactone hydrolase